MKKKAFTLIEILVVIFVFGVWILAVLKLLTNSLGYFDEISMRTKASFLAKEGIEITYWFRDSNIEKGYPWNYLSRDGEKEVYLGDEGKTVFKVGFTGGVEYWTFESAEKSDENNFESDFKDFYLELYTGTLEWENWFAYYHYVPQEEFPSKGFARIIEFSPLKEGETVLDTNKIMKVASRVLYKRGSSTGEVLLESFIGMKDSLPAEREK